MASTKSSPVLAVAVATSVAASAYFLWQRMGNKTEDEEDDDGAPDVSRETVVKFFDLLNYEQGGAVARLGSQLMQFRGKIPEQQLTEVSVNNFESHLADAQEQILKQLGISAADMEDATKYYAAEGDKEIREAMKQLKSMYLGVMGVPMDEEVQELPDDLTPERMVEAVKTYFASSLSATKDILESLRAQGKRLDDPAVMMEIHITFQKQTEAVVNAALKHFKLNTTTFQHAVAKFSDNLAVQLALKTGSEEQQKLLQSYMK